MKERGRQRIGKSATQEYLETNTITLPGERMSETDEAKGIQLVLGS